MATKIKQNLALARFCFVNAELSGTVCGIIIRNKESGDRNYGGSAGIIMLLQTRQFAFKIGSEDSPITLHSAFKNAPLRGAFY
jgi:hypothetical protein